MKLTEIFDYEIDFPLQQSGRYVLGKYEVDNQSFIFQLENRNIQVQFEDRNKHKTAEISFYQLDTSDNEGFSTTYNIKNPTKVYGAFINKAIQLYKAYDAFYIVADRKHSNNSKEFNSKKSIYSHLSDKIMKSGGGYLYERHTPSKSEWIISKYKISESGYINALHEAMKSVFGDNVEMIKY